MKNNTLTLIKTLVCCVTLVSSLLPLHAAQHEIMFEAYPVKQVFQDPSESWDEFVSRSGGVMRDYTNKSGFEAGGWLCAHASTGQGAISVISNHSQISVCASMKGCPLQGYRLTSEFMHSHPVKEHIVLTEHDLNGYPMGRMSRLFNGMRAGSRVRVGASGGRFSQADLLVGPGYLVHGDNLYYQKDGRQHLARSLGATHQTSTLEGLAARVGSDERRTAPGPKVDTKAMRTW